MNDFEKFVVTSLTDLKVDVATLKEHCRVKGCRPKVSKTKWAISFTGLGGLIGAIIGWLKA